MPRKNKLTDKNSATAEWFVAQRGRSRVRIWRVEDAARVNNRLPCHLPVRGHHPTSPGGRQYGILMKYREFTWRILGMREENKTEREKERLLLCTHLLDHGT